MFNKKTKKIERTAAPAKIITLKDLESVIGGMDPGGGGGDFGRVGGGVGGAEV